MFFKFILGTSTPKQTKNKVESSSPQTSSDDNKINIPNPLDILSKISKKGILHKYSTIYVFDV